MPVSPEVQNCVLSVLAEMIRDKICDEVRASSAFAIAANETQGISKSEPVLRYALEDQVHDRFLRVVVLHYLTARGIADTITGTLAKSGIDLKMCVAQSYDGANVMNVKHGGVHKQ